MDELDDMGEHADAAPATPAATLVVFRHDPAGGPAHILMVERSGSLAFAGGATVFPGGKVDPADSQAAVLKDHDFAPVAADRIVKTGDVVQVGPLRLTMMATPGHTTGSSSWSWQSCAERQCQTVSYIDSISALAAGPYRFTDHAHVVARFQRTFSAIAALDCGILVTPHPSVSDLFERMLGEQPLASPTACRDYAAMGRRNLNAQLVRETVK